MKLDPRLIDTISSICLALMGILTIVIITYSMLYFDPCTPCQITPCYCV